MVRALAFAVLLVVAAPGRAGPPTAEEIQAWVRDLDSPNFKTRDQAATRLRQAGSETAPALAKVAKTGSAEAADRAMRILGELTDGPDPKAEAAARRQLHRLADGESRVAGEAKALLARRRNRTLAQLALSGAKFEESRDGVTMMNLDDVGDLAAVLPLLKAFPELEELSISNKRLTSDGAKYLAELPNLRHLNLFESNIGDDGLQHLTRLKYLNWLPMGHTRVTDKGLKVISGMTRLEYVGVRGNDVTDAGLVHLRGLTNLTGLNLSETKVTDAGLKLLSPLTKLESLYLPGTAITDDGLDHLRDFKDLGFLSLSKTKTTEAGRDRLKEVLPKVRIDISP